MVKQDKPANPLRGGLFRTKNAMLRADALPNLVKQYRWVWLVGHGARVYKSASVAHLTLAHPDFSQGLPECYRRIHPK